MESRRIGGFLKTVPLEIRISLIVFKTMRIRERTQSVRPLR